MDYKVYLARQKKFRIHFKPLQILKEMGVMALPSLKGYYIVAQLRPIVCWCNPSYTATVHGNKLNFHFSLKY